MNVTTWGSWVKGAWEFFLLFLQFWGQPEIMSEKILLNRKKRKCLSEEPRKPRTGTGLVTWHFLLESSTQREMQPTYIFARHSTGSGEYHGQWPPVCPLPPGKGMEPHIQWGCQQPQAPEQAPTQSGGNPWQIYKDQSVFTLIYRYLMFHNQPFKIIIINKIIYASTNLPCNFMVVWEPQGLGGECQQCRAARVPLTPSPGARQVQRPPRVSPSFWGLRPLEQTRQ